MGAGCAVSGPSFETTKGPTIDRRGERPELPSWAERDSDCPQRERTQRDIGPVDNDYRHSKR